MRNNKGELMSPGLSDVQEGVQLVQNMVQCGMVGASYEEASKDLFACMDRYARNEMRERFAPDLIETATDEENENDPAAEAYWAATSAFFRKVYQAAAAAA